jgi:hypothetical protein
VDECSVNNGNCGENVDCVNVAGSYACGRQCPFGFTEGVYSCVPIDLVHASVRFQLRVADTYNETASAEPSLPALPELSVMITMRLEKQLALSAGRLQLVEADGAWLHYNLSPEQMASGASMACAPFEAGTTCGPKPAAEWPLAAGADGQAWCAQLCRKESGSSGCCEWLARQSAPSLAAANATVTPTTSLRSAAVGVCRWFDRAAPAACESCAALAATCARRNASDAPEQTASNVAINNLYAL